MTTNEEREAAIARIRAKLDRIPDSDAVTLDKADVRLALAAVSDTTPSEGWSTEDRRSAEAEAKSRWPIHEAHTFDTERDQIIFQQGCINGFMLGAEWWKATDQPAPTPSELSPLLADGLPGHDERGSDRAEKEAEEEPVESSASLLLGEAGVDECEGEPEERGGDVVVHASTLPATPSEPTAKVVPISYEASASCSHGVCPTGCSHLMWECKACSSEGGWGASRERLEGLASQHVCVLVAPTPSEGEREAKLLRRVERMRRQRDKARRSRDRAIAALIPPALVDRECVETVIRENSVEHHHPEYGVGLFTTCVEEIAAALAVSPAPARDEWEERVLGRRKGSGGNWELTVVKAGEVEKYRDEFPDYEYRIVRGYWLPVTEEEG